MAATLATGLFVGGLYLFCCMPVMFIGSSRGGEGLAAFMMAPCIPFLLALPGIVYETGEHLSRNKEGGILLTAYLFGTVGYLAAAILLAASAIARFDVLSGRSRPGYWSASRRHLGNPRPMRSSSRRRSKTRSLAAASAI